MKLDETNEKESFTLDDAIEISALSGQPLEDVAKTLGVIPCRHEWAGDGSDEFCVKCQLWRKDLEQLGDVTK